MLFLILALTLGQPDTTRSLYLGHLPQEDWQKVNGLVSFCLNSISRNHHLIKPKLVKDEIVFDLQNYKIDPQVYDKIMDHSNLADDFILKSLTAPYYYNLLGIKDRQDFLSLVGWTKNSENLIEGAITINSKVAKVGSSAISWRPTTTGILWEAISCSFIEDGLDIILDKNPKEYIKSSLGSLPNQLPVFMLSNEKGQLLNHDDINVAVDPFGNLGDKTAKNAISCIMCHKGSVHFFKDTIRDLLKEVKITLTNKDAALKLNNAFQQENPNALVKETNDEINRIIKDIAELTPDELQSNLIKTRNEFLTIDIVRAAKELRINKKVLENICENIKSLPLFILSKGQKIHRDIWNQELPKIKMMIDRQQGQR